MMAPYERDMYYILKDLLYNFAAALMPIRRAKCLSNSQQISYILQKIRLEYHQCIICML
jgi:hypothetical protein